MQRYKKGKSVSTNVSEIEQYFEIHTMMGLFLLPEYSKYWASEFRLNLITGTFSRKRYKGLRGSIDLVDNSLKDENKYYKLFKIRPLLEVVLAICLKV